MWENFWNLRVNDRLTRWRAFRSQISDMDLNEAAKLVNRTWNQAPIATFHLDDSSPADWPDPWTLLADNYYCDLTRALGIYFTLWFSAHRPQDMTIQVYYNRRDRERYYLVVFDSGKYVLNFWPRDIVNTRHLSKQTDLSKLYEYCADDLRVNQY